MGIDLTKPLSSQKYSNNTTYADYFSQSAIQQLTQIVVLSEEAKAAGFSIPEEDQASVDSLLQQIAENAESQSLSLDKYVAKTYGKGMNYELLKKIVEREYLANAYRTEKMGRLQPTMKRSWSPTMRRIKINSPWWTSAIRPSTRWRRRTPQRARP